MPPASGLGSQLGIATEATSGTYVPPTTFLTLLTEGLELKNDYASIAGLRPDVLVQQDGLDLLTTRHVEGDVTVVPLTAGLGKILNVLTGATVTPTGAAAAKTFVFPVGASAPDGRSLSMQVGVPGTDGVVQAKSVKGAVITALTFGMERGGALTLSMSIWATDMDTTQTLTTAVYPTAAEAFSFLSAALTIDGAAPSALVTSFSITFTFPKASDRYGLGGGGTAATPITNGQIAITGSYTTEFSGGWANYNAFRNATRRSISLTCSGKTDIVAGTKPSITFAVPKHIVNDNGTPTVSGPDIITSQQSWRAVADAAAAAATITYVTADTAL